MSLKVGETELVRVGLGTNRLSHTPEHVAFVREAVVAGVNFLDTAHLYAGGESEAGSARRSRPSPRVASWQTKGGYRPGDRRPRGAARPDRGEPAPNCAPTPWPLLPAPVRSADAARADPGGHRLVARGRADPARGPFRGRRRAYRASGAGRPGRRRPEPLGSPVGSPRNGQRAGSSTSLSASRLARTARRTARTAQPISRARLIEMSGEWMTIKRDLEEEESSGSI
jgi:hypothetical protein